MDIHFIPDAPGYRDTNLTVEFAALVDGRRVPCAISVEALEDHFDVETYDRAVWINAFARAAPASRPWRANICLSPTACPSCSRAGIFRRGGSWPEGVSNACCERLYL